MFLFIVLFSYMKDDFMWFYDDIAFDCVNGSRVPFLVWFCFVFFLFSFESWLPLSKWIQTAINYFAFFHRSLCICVCARGESQLIALCYCIIQLVLCSCSFIFNAFELFISNWLKLFTFLTISPISLNWWTKIEKK